MENPKSPGEKLSFLDTIGIIKSAINIPIRNPLFITLTFLTSLPLFCAMLIDELLVKDDHRTFKETSSLRELPPEHATRILIREMSSNLQAHVLRMIPFDILNLIVAVTTVYSASVIYTGGRSKGIRDMLYKAVTKSRWKGPLVAFLYTSSLYYISSVAMLCWSKVGHLFASLNLLSGLIWVIILIIGLVKLLEYIAKWNMGVVISILEEKSGFEAISKSAHKIKGNRLRGSVLMFLHFVWRLILINSISYVQGSSSDRLAYALLQISLLCVGKVMIWSICMVYHYDCRGRHGEKVDSEGEGL